MSASCQTESKADLMSISSIAVELFELKFVLIIFLILINAWIVLCCSLKPNCCDGSMFFSSINTKILFLIIFSRIFPIILNKLIGLYESGLLASFPGLQTAMTFAIFQIRGK